MFKPKSVAVVAGAGFVLSFLISVVSTHKFGISCGRALIFALIFGILGFAIDFVFNNFLVGNSSAGGDLAEDSHKRTFAKSSGSVVDIMIDDEKLTEDDQAPSFNININGRAALANEMFKLRQKSLDDLKVASVQSASPPKTESEVSKESEFKPVQLGKPVETVEAFSAKPKNVTKVPMTAAEKRSAERVASAQMIDALPDLEVSSEEDSGIDKPIVDKSEIIQGVDESSSPVRSLVDVADFAKNDSATIAKAIQTLLKG